jgi:hypothetical protein
MVRKCSGRGVANGVPRMGGRGLPYLGRTCRLCIWRH